MVLALVLRSVQEIKAMRGAGLSEMDSSLFSLLLIGSGLLPQIW